MTSPAFWWLAFLLAALALVYIGANAFAWWAVALALLIPFSLYGLSAWWVKTIVWLVCLIPLTTLSFPALRRPLISDRVLTRFREGVRPISENEWQAIDTGSTWWEAGLFQGRPRWKPLLKADSEELTPAERDFLAGPVEELCASLSASPPEGPDPKDVLELLKSKGFFGLAIPEDYGGKGFSAHGQSTVLLKIASRHIGAALTLMVPNTKGFARLILDHGTEQQKTAHLPAVANGQSVPALAISGSGVGTEVDALEDKGVVCRAESAGKREVLGIQLSFNRRYVGLGPVADIVVVSFRLYDPDRLLGEEEDLGLTVALLPTETPGVRRGFCHEPMHLGFCFGPVSGDVFVPLDAVVGGRERIGRGVPLMAESLVDSRLSVLPLINGAAKLVGRATGAFARIQYESRSPIGHLEGVQSALAGIAGNTYIMDAARSAADVAACAVGRPTVLASILKHQFVERGRRVIDSAMDIHGPSSVCIGSRNLIAEYYKFGPLGASQDGGYLLTHNVSIYGHGVLRTHPYLRREILAALDPRKARAFDRGFARHLRLLASNGLRSLFHGLTGTRLARAPVRVGEMRPYFRQISRLSIVFAFVTDVLILMCHGNLRSRERLSARMAAIVSELLMASTALRYCRHFGDAEIAEGLTHWGVQDCLHRVRRGFEELLVSLPAPRLRRVVRFIAFPFGLAIRPPEDALETRLATALMVPSTARDRITAGMYLSMEASDQLGRLEDALAKVTSVEPLDRKLADGVRLELISDGPLDQRLKDAVTFKLLTPDEAEMFRRAETARHEALRVDEFETAAGG